MGWNGSGGYTRTHNFSADGSANIRILASRMDEEFDDFASAMTLCLTRDGQNSPNTDINFGGGKLTNVGAAASAEDYQRVKEYIKDIPVYAKDVGGATAVVRVSVPFFVSVSAGQSPPDGTRLKVYVSDAGVKTQSTCSMYLFTPLNTSAGGQPHVAPIWTRGRKYDPASIKSDRVYEFSYDASASGWHCLNPSRSFYANQAKVKVVDNAGTVAGVAAASVNVQYSRNENQLTFSLQTLTAVSTSISGKYIVFSASGVTSYTSGADSEHAIPITVKDVVSHSWTAGIVNGQVKAHATFDTAGTTVSAAVTVVIAPFTAIFLAL